MSQTPASPAQGISGGGAKSVDVRELETVVVRFAGDSGDGMQLTGTQFTNTSALAGNDLATFPDFPAEIRAPAGTRAGVSGFQLQFGSVDVHTPGDQPDVLVAMNPAALMNNLASMRAGSTIILNSDAFDKRALEKADANGDPREDGRLSDFKVIELPLTTTTHAALDDTDLSKKEKDRSKNFFALGLMYWLYSRDMSYTEQWISQKFAGKDRLIDANLKALRAGYNLGLTTDAFPATFRVSSSDPEPGTYRNVTGNQAIALGLVAASQISKVPLFLGSYPITPASDILHELSRYKEYGVVTFQAEDEIAAVSAAIGASFGGNIGLTTSSGPGIALKGEAIGLAVMAELPLIIVDVQRGGPSTGLPTKTEQADLFQAVFGRNSDSPLIVLAPRSPSDNFWIGLEAVRLSTKYMTPVMILSDGYLANGSEPWKIPSTDDMPEIDVQFRKDPEGYLPYMRDEKTLARPWARPGTPGLEHRIGGLEKEELTGNVSYDPANHEKMVRLRAEKVENIANDIEDAELFGADEGDILILGWGGTWGALRSATQGLQNLGLKVSHMHLRHISPLPKNLGPTLGRFKKVVVAELNMGQLKALVRDRFMIDAIGYNKIQGQPFKVAEVVQRIQSILGEDNDVN